MLYEVKEVRHKELHRIGFHLYGVSRVGKCSDTKSRFMFDLDGSYRMIRQIG